VKIGPEGERAFYVGLMIAFLVMAIIFISVAASSGSIPLALLAAFFVAFSLYSAQKTEAEGA
jgi:NADH:ubiquinone oxidoreductase subunit K